MSQVNDPRQIGYHVWTTVFSSDYRKTERMAVPGGWLYQTTNWIWDEKAPPIITQTFVPVDAGIVIEQQRAEIVR